MQIVSRARLFYDPCALRALATSRRAGNHDLGGRASRRPRLHGESAGVIIVWSKADLSDSPRRTCMSSNLCSIRMVGWFLPLRTRHGTFMHVLVTLTRFEADIPSDRAAACSIGYSVAAALTCLTCANRPLSLASERRPSANAARAAWRKVRRADACYHVCCCAKTTPRAQRDFAKLCRRCHVALQSFCGALDGQLDRSIAEDMLKPSSGCEL